MHTQTVTPNCTIWRIVTAVKFESCTSYLMSSYFEGKGLLLRYSLCHFELPIKNIKTLKTFYGAIDDFSFS